MRGSARAPWISSSCDQGLQFAGVVTPEGIEIAVVAWTQFRRFRQGAHGDATLAVLVNFAIHPVQLVAADAAERGNERAAQPHRQLRPPRQQDFRVLAMLM